MEKAEDRDDRPNIVVKGTVVRHPQPRTVRGNKIVAELLVAADEISKDGVELPKPEVEAIKWQTVVLWGGEAHRAPATYKAGTEITVTGKSTERQWQGKDGMRVDRLVEEPSIVINKESDRGTPVEFEGHVTRTPELQQSQTSGKLFARVTVEGPDLGQGSNRISVVQWEERAEQAERTLEPGDKVHVKGELVARPYEKDGEQRTWHEVQRADITVLEKGRDRPEGQGIAGAAAPAADQAARSRDADPSKEGERKTGGKRRGKEKEEERGTGLIEKVKSRLRNKSTEEEQSR